MLAWPSLHAVAAMLLTCVAFWLFIRARLRIELICLLVIAALALTFYAFPIESADEDTPSRMEIAFGGFGHPALVAICCLMIIARGLVMTGALEPATRLLGRLWQFSHTLGLLFTLLGCMLISGFVNDTPVLVLMLPILLNLSQRAGVMASKTLMPVNCAILIGGMSTTIGTSTNVLVVSIAADMGVAPIGVFSFTPIVAMAALAAFAVFVVDRAAATAGDRIRRQARQSPVSLDLARRRAVIDRRQDHRRGGEAASREDYGRDSPLRAEAARRRAARQAIRFRWPARSINCATRPINAARRWRPRAS